jgi:N,N-dimethylformamidase
MHALTGYSDRWSVRAGERIRFHVGSRDDTPFTLSFSRIFCADPNPQGPGYRVVPMPSPIDGTQPGFARRAWPGSFAVATVALPPGDLSLHVTVFPTTPHKGFQTILSVRVAGIEFALAIDEVGRAQARAASAVAAGTVLRPRSWCDLSLTLADGRLTLGQGGAVFSTDGAPATPGGQADVTIAAGPPANGAPASQHFNGKIQAPKVFGANGIAVAAWDFGRNIPTQTAPDTGPQAAHARLVNLPTRAVTGSRWNGSVHDWKAAPDQYAAIHFHDDDLGDLEWPESFELPVPSDWPSGLYAAEITSTHGHDKIPFYVRPATGAPTADTAVLIPTFSYQVYSCFVRPGRGAEIAARSAEWGALPETPDMNPEFGLSTYNHHSDGSGVALASMHRPLLDTRPGQVSLMDPAPGGSGTGRIGCDSYILEWLDRIGVAHDVVTDHDLHIEGAAALAPYRLVIACQHPEYHSWRMLDGLDAFIAGGGRFMYLGGNGFYWRAEPADDSAATLEVRRAESGIRVWASEPGESYHQFGGFYGGLWRRIGRAAHRLVGNGFSAQGRHLGFPYHFTDAVLDPRLGFLRDGVEAAKPGERFGDHGFMGGGAAGFELDSFDVKYGSPAHGLVLAKGIVIHEDYGWVNEDMLVHRHPRPREDWSCADMVFFETGSGGAVFSVGSMTFVGSLLSAEGENILAKITENVVRRFRDPTPFVLPEGA